ncbi:PREDICTED: uncharacterized protein LOC106787751 isoform X1 [Polistes canadensis]|uniref:uncharacterized protein LOC106787751 isoform X1 n=2 Tax=Polistes canadensis TaxID=91411 RepID=UPI000718F03B|nr:PREDICTED: uncharacterized protein LOC106787751 isoform X1 [Polistes canadensis]
MADKNKVVSNEPAITQLSHHVQEKLCQTRPPYRQGKKLTAVKIYTINDESQHLMICDVPQLQLRQEIKKLVFPYGAVKKVHVVSNYPSEEFTEAYHIHYQDIRSARIAKHFLDGKNFYGGILHVFYAPELESISETRAKLMQRYKDVSVRLKRNKQDFTHNRELSQRQQTVTSLSFPMNEFKQTNYQTNYNEPFYYNDQQLNYESNAVTERRNIHNTEASTSTTVLPVQSEIVDTGNISGAGHSLTGIKNYDKCKKIKNYKGRSIRDNFKVKVIRPSIIDTSTILKSNIKDKNVSNNTNKTDRNTIVIKKVPDNDAIKKRIILKNSSIKQLIKPSQDLQNSIQTVKFQIRSALQKHSDKNPKS